MRRITNLLSPLRRAQVQPNQVLKPLRAQDFTQIKADRSRWPTAPAPPFQTELHPQDSSKGTLLPTQKRLRAPGMELTSESSSSAKCIENAKPRGVRMKASAYVVPGTQRGLCEGCSFPDHHHFCCSNSVQPSQLPP